ncbi:MAG: heparan N-sulfatase [Candidatus Omnitrophota bacterium]|jgi:arylsulfatase A-like enzyme|nr:MAG: heparan N-sulfatase [Candidatus Omnitrophota bacterium]
MNSAWSRRKFLAWTGLAPFSLVVPSSSSFAARKDRSEKKPNILFCIADDASYPHMGAYGCPWINTPGFDRVANEGILFTHAYTPNAKCAPSRACILTGRNSWQLEEAANHWCFFPEKFKTYPEVLVEHGYHVGYTAKGWAPGVPGTINGQKRLLTGKAYDTRKTVPPTRAINKNDYAANFQDFLDDKPDGVPFCFWYGSTEPHRAYEYESGIRKGGKNTAQIDKVFSFWPDNETVRTDMLDYAFEIEYFDLHLQKMMALLEERGELDNTLIVVTADNGMPFPRIKGQEYEYSNHLPLAIMWKQGIQKSGRIVDDYVSFIDFAPTFLELAGIQEKQSGMQSIAGRNLSDILYSKKSGRVNRKRDHVLIGKERHDIGRPNDWGYPIRGIVKDDFLYLHNFEPARWPAGNPETGYLNADGSPTKTECVQARNNPDLHHYWQWNLGKRPAEELYNVKEDPDCMKNLAETNQYKDLKTKLKEQLFVELKKQQDPRMDKKGTVFDRYPYADPNWQGFYEKRMNGDQRLPGWINKTDFDENN